jgi:type I restriction-modification system DNA methylase subunit
MQTLTQFLKEAALENSVEEVDKDRLRYTYALGTIDFISLEDTTNFFQVHADTWCENKTEFFIVNIGPGIFHICDSKTKPSFINPVANASIDSFNYSENSPKSEKYRDLFRKENIDKGKCLKEINTLLEKRKRLPVDEDLLTSLSERRKKIIELLGERANASEIAQKVLDRCIFIRFIEDRAGRSNLKRLLSYQGKVSNLIDLFDFYTDSLNGDIFEKGDIPQDISQQIIEQLGLIFGETYTYLGGQRTLSPYNFKKIPIILISNIYETFLSGTLRRNEGIVFTPENIVDYMVDKIFFESKIKHLIENGKYPTILDPSCGSGIFLVKFFAKLINAYQCKNGRKPMLEDKANIVQSFLFGIDKNNDALRIAALSLYLKIIEEETPETIDERLFGTSEHHFMFPGLKKNGNLVNADALFDDAFNGKQFDIIVGNPPWGYNYSEKEKEKIKNRWPSVSKFQSSQCFLLRVNSWAEKDTICALVINESNFINTESQRFRHRFLAVSSLKTFVDLSHLKNITFESASEPACIIFFDRLPREKIEFITPELTQFSNLTKIINEDNISHVSAEALVYNDDLWHIYSLGYAVYADLVEFIQSKQFILGSFSGDFQVGLMKYSIKSGLTELEFNEKYRSKTKINEDYYPIIDSLKDVRPFFGKKSESFLRYGPHLDRPRELSLFKDRKLVITRSWPSKAFINAEVTLFDGRFCIFKLREKFPDYYLLLFEGILNSKISKFFLGVKYRLRPEGNFPKVNLKHLKSLPIPNLEKNRYLVQEIVMLVSQIHKKGSINDQELETIDKLVFSLYSLDYYAIQQIDNYFRMEETKDYIVKNQEVEQYCDEFIATFQPFLKQDLIMNARWNVSDFFGAIVEFSISNTKLPFKPNDKELERHSLIIDKEKVTPCDNKGVPREDKVVIYNQNRLLIYKANKPSNWTKFMALQDANNEIGLFLQNLQEQKGVQS